MTNAQQWLNSKFPTRESKRKLKILRIFGDRQSNSSHHSNEDCWFGTPETSSLSGELVLRDFPNLYWITINLIVGISSISLVDCPKLEKLNCYKMSELREIKGLENCFGLVYLALDECPRLPKPYSFLDSWKREIERLKNQLAEYEREETGSQTSTESSYSDLEAKIRAKEQELANLRDTGRRSTAPLRKEIELLKKLLQFENKVKDLETREQGYQQQLAQKETAIQSKQQQITQLQSQLQAKTLSEQQARQQITQLNNQITNLTAEKTALQERMLAERQEALNGFQQEKNQLQTNLTQLKDQKDTFQKSADYLRETLKGTEKSLEEVKAELAQEQEKVRELEQEKSTASESHQTELKNRSKAYGVVQERNQELEKKLQASQTEVSQLSSWIGKLEAVSADGNALASLKNELEEANNQIIALAEELNVKKPRSYWWVYVVIGLVGVYLVMG